MPFKILARHRDQRWNVQSAFSGLTLLEQLQFHQVPIKSSCLGKGLCRQCRVQVEKGVAPINATDRKAFTSEQLSQGWRLSCGLRPKATIEIQFPQIFIFQDNLELLRKPQGKWWFACDLGTTGVELAALDGLGVWALVKALNQQVSMGADVMTRLEYAQRNGVRPLYERNILQLKKLQEKILTSLSPADLATSEFTKKMWVAGNSAVTAFLTQQSVEHLAVSPYQPESCSAQTIFIDDLEIETLPLLVSFVGGDLFAGLFLLWQQGLVTSEPWILMDVGTNSEILFWNGAALFVSSTPAGPAFEGSSISIGMRAENGAVINPRYDIASRSWRFQVIGEDTATGICGTGLIEMIGEAVRHQIISHDGEVLHADQLFLTPTLFLSQDDIREFQLAKSAIQTGLELVQDESAVAPQKLYLAGAFGKNLSLNACRDIKLLPDMPTETLGNASLKGCLSWSQASTDERLSFQDWLTRVMKPIELALSDRFQQVFVRNMNL